MNKTFIYLNTKDVAYINGNKFNFVKNNYIVKWIDNIDENVISNIIESNNTFEKENKITNESLYINTLSQNSLSFSNSFFLGYEKINIYDSITDITSEKCVTEIKCNMDINAEGSLENGINGQLKIIINNINKGQFKIKYNSNLSNNEELILNNFEKKAYRLIWSDKYWLLC